VAELVAIANSHPGRTVVVTGGEPFLHADLRELCLALQQAGHPVHLETSGSLFQDVPADLVCLSPKLVSSTPDSKLHPKWSVQHEVARFPVEILRRMVSYYGDRLWLKFVVATEADIQEVESWLETVGITDRSRVMLMPQARTPEVLSGLAEFVANWCIAKGYRYSDRLHIRLWGDTPGK